VSATSIRCGAAEKTQKCERENDKKFAAALSPRQPDAALQRRHKNVREKNDKKFAAALSPRQSVMCRCREDTKCVREKMAKKCRSVFSPRESDEALQRRHKLNRHVKQTIQKKHVKRMCLHAIMCVSYWRLGGRALFLSMPTTRVCLRKQRLGSHKTPMRHSLLYLKNTTGYTTRTHPHQKKRYKHLKRRSCTRKVANTLTQSWRVVDHGSHNKLSHYLRRPLLYGTR
jgi:hypothetical protein